MWLDAFWYYPLAFISVKKSGFVFKYGAFDTTRTALPALSRHFEMLEIVVRSPELHLISIY